MSRGRKPGQLTAKQERFCLEYLVDWNATQAAVRAGFSLKTARQQGARLLSNVAIQQQIVSLRTDRDTRIEYSRDEWLRQGIEWIRFIPMNAFELLEDGTPTLNLAKCPSEVRNAVAQVRPKVQLVGDPNQSLPILDLGIVFVDRLKAWIEVGKAQGYYVQKPGGGVDEPPTESGSDEFIQRMTALADRLGIKPIKQA